MELNLDTILVIVSAVLGILAMVLGVKFTNAKGKAGQLLSLGKEGMDVISAAVKALDDNTITKDEIEIIKKEALEVRNAWRLLIGKDA